MNIFATSPCPRECAQVLDNKRVVKMCLETAQLLSNAGHGPYKSTHIHHPCSKWICSDPVHIWWTHLHLYWLNKEYKKFAYKDHKSWCDVERYMSNNSYHHSVGLELLRFVPSTFNNSARNRELGLDFTHLPVHEAYRKYLCARWSTDKRSPSWAGRVKSKPEWYNNA